MRRSKLRTAQQMLRAQSDGLRVHKAMALVWMSDCYSRLGFRVHAKRYYTFCPACLDAELHDGGGPLRPTSTDYDVICSMDGLDVDFRSELGRYFVCECKDWASAADFTTMAKFCRVLDSTKAKFGLLFSSSGITGDGKAMFAEREQLKVFHDRGIVIVVLDHADVQAVAAGKNLISLLRDRYEAVRLDLRARSDAD